MKSVFADTFFFLALVNRRDTHHLRAVEESQKPELRLLTTAWVISELGNALSKGNNRQIFLQLYEVLSDSSIHTIVEPSQDLLDQGLGLFAERPDKHWSLTDCISFVIMQQYGLSHALTADHHFEQAGFVAMLTA